MDTTVYDSRIEEACFAVKRHLAYSGLDLTKITAFKNEAVKAIWVLLRFSDHQDAANVSVLLPLSERGIPTGDVKLTSVTYRHERDGDSLTAAGMIGKTLVEVSKLGVIAREAATVGMTVPESE